MLAFANAVGHNLRAKSLDEARNLHSSFEATRSAWTPVQITIACLGIVFAFLGKEIVDFISNGKFTEAATYIPAIFLVALLQSTEQAANAIICTSNRAASATWPRTIMGLGTFIILLPTIVIFGIKGVLVVCIVEAVAYRSYLRTLASRERNVPFHDHVVVLGSSTIMTGMACMHWASPTLTIQLGLTMLGIGMLLAIGRRSTSDIIFAGRQIMLGELNATYSSASITMSRTSPSLL